MAKQLSDSVAVLSGVGPKKVQALNKLGINTIEDLLTAYPFRYDDYAARKLAEIGDQEKVALKGTVATEPVLSRFGRQKNRLNFKLLVEHDVIMVTFFNQGYLRSRIELGKELTVYGKWNHKRQNLTGMKILADDNSNELGGVYRSSKEIKQSQVKKLIEQAYDEYEDAIVDIIPDYLAKKYHLLSRKEIIHEIHFPKDQKSVKLARRSGTFEEFFLFQARMQYIKENDNINEGLKINYKLGKLKQFIARLPFELTNSQKKVVNEICHDMHMQRHMNRLLQGDVGSGKTIVAAIIMYAAITAGFQTALMVPTEILAQQHATKLAQLFEPMGVTVALLTSSTVTRVAQRRELLSNLKKGTINLVVGTHALIQPDIEFLNLGLVVTDEQHRFGVGQRQILREKGKSPDVLMMTATPIPRTLALTTYGEMDVSTIRELPKGRKAIRTQWVKNRQLASAYEFLERELANNSQAYIVSPLIEESEAMDLKNAEEIFNKTNEHLGSRYQVGLLHGKMSGEEKEKVMSAFKEHKIDVLVATTVIEVGVDVANATVMMILDADRFGLAQLHQLRGRVGRGDKQSYCLLVADPKNEYGIARMQIMTETNNGFVIAQKDLELRGQGDILGNKQSGIPEFKLGDPIADLRILQIAKEEARQIINNEHFKQKKENEELIKYLNRTLLGASFD
ncbi:ATP-dependent DNA helicase RecG [Liquorilactobacillus mali]|uniref:ATP-dependent DNA helicase RecG n=1 Tax=Liquorilactobacillus mali TaxID=1618 RepID=UPI0002491462|nr:ATP-dependent DNA helicase RecG [Liquorilactobacillus mali]EJE98182.1 ATP-dependent DNA helicase [Liquorilactobacillus mali KCTC 3596 = DSM 20444]MDC7951927.1 ATP-dependent DNA helicase RecG [Liquorilactobacillus mali]QFQ75026.1 ATP-dependent DNA helicase RecG [Liquorilactobacillus mali]